MAIGRISKSSQSFGQNLSDSRMRLAGDGSPVVNDQLFQLGMDAKIFICGVGIEGTALTVQTSLAETTPDLILKSPPGGKSVIIPLSFNALMSNEGGDAPDWYISLLTDDVAIATAGTTIVPQCIGSIGAGSDATIQTAPTMAAYVNSQNCLLDTSQNTLDNIISVEGATTVVLVDDLMNNKTKIIWKAPVPICLRDGQAWAFHGVTGTAGMQLEWTLIYAELPGDI